MSNCKKVAMFLVVMFCVALVTPVAFASEKKDFIFVSPAGKEEWVRGSTYQIEFRSANPPQGSERKGFIKGAIKVNIILRSTETGPHYGIKDEFTLNANGGGRYSWTVPNYVPEGKYRIQVVNVDGYYKTGYSNEFKVLEKSPPIKLPRTKDIGGYNQRR